MTIPSSGTITSADIAAEIGYPFTIPSTTTRNLTGVAAGSIVWPTDFYGQTGGGTCAEGTTGSDTTSGGVASVAGLSFGATAWNRRIFVAVEWACITTATVASISSATIGGVAATIHVQLNTAGTSASSNYGVGIISATVPTGASGTVAITFSNATVRTVNATTYRVTGLVSATATDTATAFQEDLGVPSSPSAQSTCTVPSSGLLFVAGVVSSAAGLGALTFTGATERVDAAGGVQDRYGSAMSFALGSQSNRPVGVAGSSSTNASRARMVAASFQLA